MGRVHADTRRMRVVNYDITRCVLRRQSGGFVASRLAASRAASMVVSRTRIPARQRDATSDAFAIRTARSKFTAHSRCDSRHSRSVRDDLQITSIPAVVGRWAPDSRRLD